MNGIQIDAVNNALAEKDAEIARLNDARGEQDLLINQLRGQIEHWQTLANHGLFTERELRIEIERLQSSPTSEETEELIARLRGPAGELTQTFERHEAAEALHRLSRNQMSSSYVTLAQASAMQAQRADAVERKAVDAVAALKTAMVLIDELVTENGRLCAASKEPPNVRLFAAKNSFDTAMKRLLGDTPEPTAKDDTT